MTVGAALGRFGLGVALAAVYVGALRGLPANSSAQGASLSTFVQSVGGALGAGLVGDFLDWRLATLQVTTVTAAHPVDVLGTRQAMDDSLWVLALLASVAGVLGLGVRRVGDRD